MATCYSPCQTASNVAPENSHVLSAELFVQSIGTGGYELLPPDLQNMPQVKAWLGIRFDWTDFAKETLLPVLDYVSDLASAFTFWQAGRFQFLAAIGIGVLVNTLGSSGIFARQMLGRGMGICSTAGLTVLNILTLGLVAILTDSYIALQGGRKTGSTKWLKFLEAVESFFSFGVNVYSLLIAGYLRGYPKPTLIQACIRYTSIATSVVCLPLAIGAYSVQQTKDNPNKFSKNTAWRSLATLHHASDLAFPLLVLLFQLFHRPWGMFAVVFVYWLALATLCIFIAPDPTLCMRVAVGAGGATLVSALTIPFSAYETFQAGDGVWPLVMARPGICFLLLFVLAFEAHANNALMDQLTEPHVLPIVALAIISTTVLPITTLTQRLTGRWQ
eukprot:TRINITY_DN23139_c0_g1_i4.p1 TRINITY_DN23139_c0_g1~~TRINITY_DN23139_c0_g1_i4.p1  ORF type:complete len:406 (+),score=25.72 TRINITY_DN23139_c0_g1_i4:56-1219(+)